MRIRTIAIAGLAGAAVAYLFDPIAGSTRRSRLRERIATFAQQRTMPDRKRSPLPDNMIPAPEAEISDLPEEPSKENVPDMPEEPSKENVPDMPEEPSKENVPDMPEEPSKENVPDMPEEPSKDKVADTREDRPMDDAAIAGRIRMKVLGRPDLETGSLVVDVVRGVAFLRGDLKDRRQIDEVVDLTGAVPGVQKVQNLIHLPESPTNSRPAAPLGDALNG